MAKPPGNQLTEKEIQNIIDTEKKTNDRPGAYLALWQLAGSPEPLEQARISSFSGTVGGTAFEANLIDKELLGPRYPGVFSLSEDVFHDSMAAVDENVSRVNARRVSLDQIMFRGDKTAWQDANLFWEFPGNALGLHNPATGKTLSVASEFFGYGTLDSGLASKLDTGFIFSMPSLYSKLPSYFSGLPGYHTERLTERDEEPVSEILGPNGRVAYVGLSGLLGKALNADLSVDPLRSLYNSAGVGLESQGVATGRVSLGSVEPKFDPEAAIGSRVRATGSDFRDYYRTIRRDIGLGWGGEDRTGPHSASEQFGAENEWFLRAPEAFAHTAETRRRAKARVLLGPAETGDIQAFEAKRSRQPLYQFGLLQRPLDQLEVIPGHAESGGDLEVNLGDPYGGMAGAYAAALGPGGMLGNFGQLDDLSAVGRPGERPQIYSSVDTAMERANDAAEAEFSVGNGSWHGVPRSGERNSITGADAGDDFERREIDRLAAPPEWFVAWTRAMAKAENGLSVDGAADGPAGRQSQVEPGGAISYPRVRVVNPPALYRSHMPTGSTASMPSQSLPIPGQVLFSP